MERFQWVRRHVAEKLDLHLQNGIQREGIRDQLRLAPVMFDTAEEVLTDFRQRVSGWTVPAQSLVATWKWKTVRRRETATTIGCASI